MSQDQHKVRVTINGRDHETHQGGNTVEHLRQLGKIPVDEILGELKKDHQWVSLDDKGQLEIHGGEIFASYHKDHPHKVMIIINGKEYHTHPGINPVEHLRHIGHVPTGDVLSEFKDGQWIDLKDDAYVEIQGGEKFASHVPSSGSS